MLVHEILAMADSATALLIAFGFGVAAIVNRKSVAFRWWAASFALLGIAMATVTMRAPMPAFWTQSVSWTALFGAFVTMFIGLNAAEGRRVLGMGVLAAAAVMWVAIAVFLTMQVAPPPLWYYLGPAPALVLVAAALFRLRPQKSMDWIFALGLVVFSVIVVARSLAFADMFFDGHPPRPQLADIRPVQLDNAQLQRGVFLAQDRSGPPRPGLRPPPPRGARHLPPPNFQRPPPGFDRAAQLGVPPGERGQQRLGGRPSIEQPLLITLLTIAGLLGLAVLLGFRVALPAVDRLREMSTTDGMTGLLNRRAFDEQASQLLAQPDGLPVCAVLVDVDHFKRVNDQCGHAAGDRVIARLGAILSVAIEGRQVAGRIGGEEFAVVLPASNLAAARLFAENIRTQFSAIDFGGEIPWRMTLSAGVAQCADGERLHALMRRADKALYAAKNGGRDRVETENKPQDIWAARASHNIERSAI